MKLSMMIVALLALVFSMTAQTPTATTTAKNKASEQSEQAKQGTFFRSGTLKELLKAAATEKRYLFVDVYASWCPPCKFMATQVFPQPEVGAYFNATFVNAKFDAEKGEGVNVAKRYKVDRYPTFLIIDSTGVEKARILGGAQSATFIKNIKETVAGLKK